MARCRGVLTGAACLACLRAGLAFFSSGQPLSGHSRRLLVSGLIVTLSDLRGTVPALASDLAASKMGAPLDGASMGAPRALRPDDLRSLQTALAVLDTDPRRPGAMREFEKAEEALSNVIARLEGQASPQESAQFYTLRAQARITINDMTGGELPEKAEGAVADYSEVIKLMETDIAAAENAYDYANLFVRRGLAKEEIAYGRGEKQQWAGAVADYSRSIELWRSKPRSADGLGVNPLVLNYRGNALSQLGRYQEAVVDYTEATDIFQRDNEYVQAAVSRCNEALARFGDGGRDEAIRILQSVRARNPSLVDPRVVLAAVYWKNGERAQAETEWSYACENTQEGCAKYKDLDWVQNIRRFPPLLVAELKSFLRRDTKEVLL